MIGPALAEVLDWVCNLQRPLPTSRMPCIQYRWQIGPSYFGSGTANKKGIMLRSAETELYLKYLPQRYGYI